MTVGAATGNTAPNSLFFPRIPPPPLLVRSRGVLILPAPWRGRKVWRLPRPSWLNGCRPFGRAQNIEQTSFNWQDLELILGGGAFPRPSIRTQIAAADAGVIAGLLAIQSKCALRGRDFLDPPTIAKQTSRLVSQNPSPTSPAFILRPRGAVYFGPRIRMAAARPTRASPWPKDKVLTFVVDRAI